MVDTLPRVIFSLDLLYDIVCDSFIRILYLKLFVHILGHLRDRPYDFVKVFHLDVEDLCDSRLTSY